MVSISILLYGQLLQVIGYIETRTDIKYDKKEDMVNMCKAWDDHKKLGIQEGMQRGMQQGMQQGEHSINSLILCLAELGRTSDIIRSAADPEYQKKLLKEFGLLLE